MKKRRFPRLITLVAGSLCLLLIAVAVYRFLRPAPALTGLAQPSASITQSAATALTRAGYAPVGEVAWATTATGWELPGVYQVFFAAAPTGGPADIYRATASLDGDGQVVRIQNVTRLTDTPAGDELSPLVAGEWLAFATRVAGYFQSITCLALNEPSQREVFVFDEPVEQVELAWSKAEGTGQPALAIVATGSDRQTAFSVMPTAISITPADAGLRHIPQAAGEQAWLPNLVSRVRELPFVGPEKIAFLENLFFTLVDQFERWRYGVTGIADRPEVLPAYEPPTAAESEPSPAPTVPAQEVAPLPVPTVPLLETSAATATVTLPASAATQIPAAPLAPTAPPTARPSPAPSPTLTAIPIADGIRRRTPIRPDPQRPYAEVELIEIDPALLQIKMVPGTIEPRPTTGLIGSGVIPQADWPALVAGFNGGFAAMHGMYGMMVDRKVYLHPRDGIATLAVYEDGSLRMGTWGQDLVQTPDMVSFRQNCPPLIENGLITAETGKLTLWGLSVANEVYLYRSGLGLTADGRLIYAAGKPLSAYTLARAMQAAGAVYAMQLDVDEFHVAFITYEWSAGKLTGKKLRNDMRGFDGLFLRPFQLDFFYLVRRPQPLAQPVRLAASAAPTPVRPTSTLTQTLPADLPGALAFASNRDGNWELYMITLAGRTDPTSLEAIRLTDHPADDLYPAWSPDGKQLAFASRRDGNSEIYILNLADASVQRVTHQPSEEWAPAWSPDGKRLAYQSDRNGQSDIYVSAPDGRDETRLTPYEGNHEAPHWAPDGRRIVFDSDLDVGEAVHASINIYLMNADGSNPRRLISYGESPAWSPDGKTIAFTAMRGGHWQVLLINVDGSGYRQLTTGAYAARYPAWSPDGRWLAFAGNETGHWEIYVIAAAGGRPWRVTYGTADNSYPAWRK